MEQAQVHAPWNDLLEELQKDPKSKVSDPFLGRVLRRVLLGGGMAGGDGVPQVEIRRGTALGGPDISTGTVAKATQALERERLLTGPDPGSGGAKRPFFLGRDRWIIGFHVEDRHRKLQQVTGVLTRLDGEEIASVEAAADPPPEEDAFSIPHHEAGEDLGVLVDTVEKLVDELCNNAQRTLGVRPPLHDILGVGVEIGGHVLANGDVLLRSDACQDRLRIGVDLAARLKIPTVVENDTNARAIHALYRGELTPEVDAALVQVFEEGVGGALVIDGWVYRGGGAGAMEVGHLTVEPRELINGETGQPILGFDDPCLCSPSRFGHVDALATPARIWGQLEGKISLEAAAAKPSLERDSERPEALRLSDEGIVFRRAGTALGRGLAHVINIVNPRQLLLRLPTALAAPAPQTSGAQYLAAVEAMVNEAFSTGPQDARAGGQRLPVEAVAPESVPHEGALAAAAAVLHRFVEHAVNRDGCPRRIIGDSAGKTASNGQGIGASG